MDWRGDYNGRLLGWLAAFVLLSLVVGQIVTRIVDMLANPLARQLITVLSGVDEVTKAFVAVELICRRLPTAAYSGRQCSRA